MLANTSPLQVLRRDTYSPAGSDPRDERTIAWKDGQLVEFVTLFDPDTGSMFDATVDQGLNGGVHAGDVGACQFDWRVEDKPVQSKTGRDYIAKKHKLRLVGFNPATAG